MNDKIPGRAGMVGGCLLNIAITFDVSHLFNSIILAAIGTAVSFLVTKAMKLIFED